MQLCTGPPSSEGAMGGVQGFQAAIYHRTLWAYLSLSTTDSEGCVCGHSSMCDGSHAGFPRRATLAAPKGECPYTEATPSGAAPTSPPEGVFRHKRRMELDKLSGHTTGRLGCIGPTLLRGYVGSITSRTTGRAMSCTMALQIELHSDARLTNTATAPPRLWTGRRTTLDTYIWRSRPCAPGAPEVMTPTCAAGDRTRSAEVCYTAGLNNAGCATRLHQ